MKSSAAAFLIAMSIFYRDFGKISGLVSRFPRPKPRDKFMFYRIQGCQHLLQQKLDENFEKFAL